jgi:hypothetical protein
MKARKFREETTLNFYEKEGKKFEIKTSLTIEGLLNTEDLPTIIIQNRTACGSREYQIHDINLSIYDSSLWILKTENEGIRKKFPRKGIITKTYDLYALSEERFNSPIK